MRILVAEDDPTTAGYIADGLRQEGHAVDQLSEGREALARADSIVGALLTERSPEVLWILPPALRHAAAQAPGMLADPDRIGTALLRGPKVEAIPDPLRSQMRQLGMSVGVVYSFRDDRFSSYFEGDAGALIDRLDSEGHFAIVRLIQAWPEIVGQRFADCSRPERIAWPRGAAREGESGVLEIRVDGPRAL